MIPLLPRSYCSTSCSSHPKALDQWGRPIHDLREHARSFAPLAFEVLEYQLSSNVGLVN